jgi:predicted RNA-binding protein with PIN domain
MIKFFRGPAESFDKVLHKDGLYFAIDKGEIYLNDSVYGSDETVTDVKMTEDGTALIVSRKGQDDKTIDLVELMAKASATGAGLMTAADKIALDKLSAAFKNDELGKVQGVAEGDKILSMTDKLVSATVSLTYDEANKKIKLVGKDNADLGEVDASAFIKDGMLDDVSVETIVADEEGNVPAGTVAGEKYVKFTWKVQDGEALKTDYIAVADLAKTYVAGNAISISENNEIGVIVAASTETQTNYLVNDGGLKVAEMGAGVTKLAQEIQVVGGPLADDLKDIFPNNIIPAGTSVETILMKMICKEIFPTASTSQGSISTSMSLTTLAFDPTDATVEVGTIVTTNALTANNSNYSTTPAKITGLTNGYSLTESGDKVTGDMEFAVEGVSEATNNHKITFTYTGFTETAPTAVEAASTVTMPAQTLVVREGECKVSVSASGSKFTATSPSVSQTYYNISNVNTRQAETKTISTKSLSSTASKTTSDKVTGVYKYFMGYYDFASNQVVEDVFTSDIIRGLTVNTGDITKDGTTTLVDSTAKTSNGKSIVIAVPSKYKLATFQNDLGGDEVGSFSKTGTVAVANPTNKDFTTDYIVYVWPIAGGATIKHKNVTITKA